MSYDYKNKKIVVLIEESLPGWVALNAVGHLATALGANKDAELMGRAVLTDASNIKHTGIARFGFIIKKSNSAGIRKTIEAARQKTEITMIDFPQEMLDTRHDDELAQTISQVAEPNLKYLGVLLYGTSTIVDELTKDFRLFS